MVNAIPYFLVTGLVGSGLLASTASVSTCSPSPIATGAKPGSFCTGEITLKSDGTEPGILIIDHGVNVGGFPTFEVLSLSGDTSVFEMTYSETRGLLDNYMVRPFHIPFTKIIHPPFNLTLETIVLRDNVQFK